MGNGYILNLIPILFWTIDIFGTVSYTRIWLIWWKLFYDMKRNDTSTNASVSKCHYQSSGSC